MKKSIKTIVTIAAMGVMIVCAYLLGTMQAETITEVRQIIPDNYISLDDCIPLQDVACCFIDGYDYPCFEIGDITHQLDDSATEYGLQLYFEDGTGYYWEYEQIYNDIFKAMSIDAHSLSFWSFIRSQLYSYVMILGANSALNGLGVTLLGYG